ncbi:AMP-binding protein [uncultured Maribacter sp.]|uniref:AMP-binding protein n=1 Tax=uncultured Maribacter sp. TaxID=431308 RepID=UPI00261CD8FE|nr:AMP-binding protein [uncultured Maribacter sp.]
MDWNNIHSDFQLNGVVVSKKGITELSCYLIKEGVTFEKEIGEFLQQWINATETVVVQTSGSTGVPKSIELQKKHMVNSARATGAFFHLKPKDSALLCMSVSYIAGKMMLVRAMVLGLHLTAISAKSNPLEGISRAFDFSAMVPMQLQNSLDKIKSIKTVIIGGAPMSLTLIEKIKDIKTRVFETYGMTETITHIALKKISKNSENTFIALPEVILSKDNRGCLVINAPQISNIPVVTNDLVELLSETEFTWLGRYDSIINSGGVKLIPEQIEEKLSSIIKNRFFVAGIPDEILGQKLVLLIEGEIDTLEVVGKIKQLPNIGKYQIPKEAHSVPCFVYTPNGKINRKATLESLNL